MRETVLVSECCVGVRCRYRHNGYARKIIDKIGQECDILAVCPEVAGGLPTPREGCEVRDGRVIGRRTGRDYTAEYTDGAQQALDKCHTLNVRRAYLLRHSPSCGVGYGLTALLLADQGIEIIPI